MNRTTWFRSQSVNEVPDKFDRLAQSWDIANKATQLRGFSVCTTWEVKK
jgi:hypothetical protein